MAHANRVRQLQPQGSISDQWGRVSDGSQSLADTDGADLQGGGNSMTRKDGKSRSDMLDWAVEYQTGMRLNPMWVEWLMAWPLGWTDLKPLEMDKSHSAPQPHGDCSPVKAADSLA
jgi:hypothetical protein